MSGSLLPPPPLLKEVVAFSVNNLNPLICAKFGKKLLSREGKNVKSSQMDGLTKTDDGQKTFISGELKT